MKKISALAVLMSFCALCFGSSAPRLDVSSLTLRAYMDSPKSANEYSKVLWYNEETEEYYCSNSPYSSPSSFKKLFTFVPQDGYPSRNYTTAFLPNGDVLFIYDSQFGGEALTEAEYSAP